MKGLMLLPLILVVLVVSVCYVEASPAIERDAEETLLNLLARVLDDQDGKSTKESEMKKDRGAAKEEQMKKDGQPGQMKKDGQLGQGAAKEEQMKKDGLPGQVKKDGQPGQLVEKAESGMENILEERQQTLCPEGWNNHGSNCYKPINTRYTYQEAQNACEQEDALSYVAVANDAAENEFVNDIALGVEIWLGCTAFGGDHVWTCSDGSIKWYDTKTRTASPADSYWNWATDQPAIDGEQCQLQYQNGEWHDYSCSSLFQVVCELPLVCPEGWTHHGSSCYKPIDTRYTYQEAQNACEQEHALSYVAVANDAVENAFVNGLSVGGVNWLGCTAFGGLFVWTCPDGTNKLYYTVIRLASPAGSYWNWAPNQPMINGEECQVQFGDREWHDYPCSSLFHVVCELTIPDKLRLVGGNDRYEGRVEICRAGSGCGTICDDGWGQEEAAVVCKQLGYSYSAASAISFGLFGPGSGSIFLDDVVCTGDETNLASCFNAGWGSHNCGHWEDAGVICRGNGDLRLVGNSADGLSGRVEMRYNNDEWGTMCDVSSSNPSADDDWDDANAKVVCRQLGLPYSNARTDRLDYWLRRHDRILLEYVDCTGYEERLDQCYHRFNKLGRDACYYETAAVVCA